MEPSGARVRVLLVDMPNLAREIVASWLANEPDIDVQACTSLPDVPDEIAQSGVDFVILAPKDPDVLGLRPLLAAGGHVKAITLDTGGGEGVLYELWSLHDTSSESLLRTIRGAAQPT
jgi:hypothetical protein